VDAALRQCAKRTPDLTDPNWFEKMQAAPHPLDESGTRAAAEALLAELVDRYPVMAEASRADIRKLFADHTSFAWATGLPYPPTTEASFRAHLILFAIDDQGRDARDAVISLQVLLEKATAVGVRTGPILRQVADLASEVNKYGMGSTRSMLLARAQPPASGSMHSTVHGG
jgi:hypothetical protein